eukprot:GEZU01012023.1.p1 GENE.GEZU01012023.1~~GEZU01012023.1.p1  ORF type:complete len:105 (+),score=14.71 GEZU01012023.1:352-666(+)
MMKNEDTLRKLQLKNDTKLLLVGSTVEQVIQVATPVVAAAPVAAVEEEAPSTKLADQREHKKIIDKGVPEDAIKGFTDRHVCSSCSTSFCLSQSTPPRVCALKT